VIPKKVVLCLLFVAFISGMSVGYGLPRLRVSLVKEEKCQAVENEWEPGRSQVSEDQNRRSP